MSNLCVIGLQWGDEAKGKIVDLLTPRFDIVVRYQGGSNAGHTVVADGQTYKLHLIPSGILNPQSTNVIAPGVVVHPETLLREIEGLESRGVRLAGRLLISERAHVVCPWHILEDQQESQPEPGEEGIGTTLRGIGPCYRDKAGRKHALRMGDLVRKGLFERVEQICRHKSRLLAALGQPGPVLDPETITRDLRGSGEALAPFIADTSHYLLDAAEAGKTILFEGAQGALLDIDHGTYPFVTSSNSSGAGITAGSGVPPRWIHEVLGVAKSYSTRVGGGPFPTELDNEIGERIRQRGREYGTTTGRPRRCGWFDAVAVRYTARLSGVDQIGLMMLDVLSEFDELQICTAYRLDGKTIRDFPGHVDDVRRVTPVYETLPGWKTEISHIRRLEDLPENAIRYVRRVSELAGRPVGLVSVGPDRSQTIFCGEGIPVVAAGPL